MKFRDREEAGRLLASKLKKIIRGKDFVVAAVARGGVVLGRTIADCLKIPLSVLVIKKMGAPSNLELAIGAVGPKKTVFWDKELLVNLRVDQNYRRDIFRRKTKEVSNFGKILREHGNNLGFERMQVIVVDDGVATGTTVICASKFLKKENVKRIILATPVISRYTFYSIKEYFDAIVSLDVLEEFHSVGQFYEDFPQIDNETVIKLLKTKNI